MRNFLQNLSTIYLFLYNSLKMNNLRKIIVIQDIYFIYIDKKVSKKLINKMVVRVASEVVTNFCLNCCITII